MPLQKNYFQNKLILWDYIASRVIKKIVDPDDWHLYSTNPNRIWEKPIESDITKDNKFIPLPHYFLHRLVYLISVLSVNNSMKSCSQTPFAVMDNWRAEPYGPVEDNVFMSDTYLPTILAERGKVDYQIPLTEYPYSRNLTKIELKESIKRYSKTNLDNCKDFFGNNFPQSDNNDEIQQTLISKYNLNEQTALIDKTIDKSLSLIIPVIPYEPTFIDCTHTMLWGAAARWNDSKTMFLKNIYLLQEEKQSILNYIKERGHVY